MRLTSKLLLYGKLHCLRTEQEDKVCLGIIAHPAFLWVLLYLELR